MRWLLIAALLVVTGCSFNGDDGACSTEDGELVYDLLARIIHE